MASSEEYLHYVLDLPGQVPQLPHPNKKPSRTAIDGTHYGACTTTHIYCRPLCPAASHVNRKNVVYFKSAAEAEKAGYRPCLTCCPEAAPGPSSLYVSDGAVELDRLVKANITQMDIRATVAKLTNKTLAELDEIALSSFGATFDEYVATLRRLAAKDLLRKGNPPLEDVAAACGFASGEALAAEFATRYKLDAQKLADKKPYSPRLSKANA